MNKKLLTLLCCPVCKKDLHRVNNSFVCRHCKKTYTSVFGIPILVDLASLPSHLQGQIAYFEKEDVSRRGGYILEPWQRRYVDKFLHIGKPKPGGLIVDNATGSGYIAIEMARRGYYVIATDLTFRELMTLKRVLREKKLLHRVLLVCASSEELPIQSKSADGLVANAILEHLPREKKAIEEITRVVKKQAPVMVAMPLVFRLIFPLLWFPNWWHDRKIGHLRRYDRADILSKFKGFSEVSTYYTGHLVKVFCLAMFLVTKKPWWNRVGEQWDRVFEQLPYSASNVVSILRRT